MTAYITAADVWEWIDAEAPTTDTRDAAVMDRVIAAVNRRVDRYYTVPADLPAEDLVELELGLVMFAARLYKRRVTPEGIGGNANIGAVYITRFDPNVDDLLAPYLRPALA